MITAKEDKKQVLPQIAENTVIEGRSEYSAWLSNKRKEYAKQTDNIYDNYS